MKEAMLWCIVLTSAAALQLPPIGPLPTTRRTALAGVLAPLCVAPLAARAMDQLEAGGALGATCLGFGCNPYQNPDYNGMAAEDAPKGSLPYPDFIQAIKEKKVEGVVFMPPSGDEAYALIGGKSVRIGEGWPVEVSNSWSSPTWVVRILDNERIPYAFNYDLGSRRQGRKPTVKVRELGSGPPPKYEPAKKKTDAMRPSLERDPSIKFYGGA